MGKRVEEETGCQHEYTCGPSLGDWIPGECKKCGQKVEFPFDGIGEKRILSVGNIKRGGELKKKAERMKFYKENKEAIISDLAELGGPQTRKKWGIPSSTLAYLKKRWGMPVKGRGQKQTCEQAVPGKERVSLRKDGLPPFPAFSENWAPEVQAKWLEVYPGMARRT